MRTVEIACPVCGSREIIGRSLEQVRVSYRIDFYRDDRGNLIANEGNETDRELMDTDHDELCACEDCGAELDPSDLEEGDEEE